MFWRSFNEGLGTKMKLSTTTFHPQTDGQAENIIQTLEDMLRACIIDFKGYWDKHFSFVEFLTTIVTIHVYLWLLMKLYSMRCISPIGCLDVGESSFSGPKLIYRTLEKVYIIRNRLKTAYSQQKSYLDHRRRDLVFEEGDKV